MELFKFNDDFLPNHKYDYAKKREYLTPRREPSGLSFRKKTQIILLLIFVAALFGFIVFHPFFSIKQFNISGLNRINRTQFESSVETIINCKKFWLFPCANYIFVDVNEIATILNEKYSLDSVLVKKEFPDSLTVTLEEKISTIIYDDTKNYRFVDLKGDFVETLYMISSDEWQEEIIDNVSTTVHYPNNKRLINEFGDYPIIYDRQDYILEVSGLSAQPIFVQNVIDWYNFLNKKLNLSFAYLEITSAVGDARIFTKKGWLIYIKLGERFGEQSDQLAYLLNNKISNDANIEYIELRFPDRVYWK